MGRPSGRAVGRANPFAGTHSITLPQRINPARLDVFAADAKRVARFYDDATDRAIYVVGRATHPSVSDESLMKWCGDAASKDPAQLRELLGASVVLIDERRSGEIRFISDPLGLLPWFTGQSNGRLVAGTDVLGICDAGLSTGEVDYDAVANWLCYSFVTTGGSVVRDYKRLDPATVASFHPDGTSSRDRTYAQVKYVTNVVSQDDLTDGLHECVRTSFQNLIRGVDEINLPLSGGYDSRLLCAMAARERGLKFHLTVVGTTPGETFNARRVADLLGFPLEEMPCPRAKIDLFDDPLYFLAEGFPIARNLTNAIARSRPGMPLLSGYIGDGLMRGPMTPGGVAYMGLDGVADTLTDETLARATHDRCHLLTNRMHLLRDGIGPRAHERSTAAMSDTIRFARATGRPIAWTNLFVRQRLYFANIFLSHLDVADALLPFASWELVDFNAKHAGSLLGTTYDHLFRRLYPELGGIPHNLDVKDLTEKTKGNAGVDSRPTRHLRRWGSELLRGLPRVLADGTAINAKKLMKRLPGALLLDGQYADEIGYLHRIDAFEKRAAQAGIRLDWSLI